MRYAWFVTLVLLSINPHVLTWAHPQEKGTSTFVSDVYFFHLQGLPVITEAFPGAREFCSEKHLPEDCSSDCWVQTVTCSHTHGVHSSSS